MPKSDLGDVCGRYLPATLLRPAESSLLNDQQSINAYTKNEQNSLEHKRSTLLPNQISSKNQQIQSLDKLNQDFSSENYQNQSMPANNDVLLTSFNNNTSTSTNGTNGNHQYRTTYASCSNGNGNDNSNHSLSSSTSSSSNDSSTLMMNWELLKDRGSGLVNLGNTCFINASLQCLANTPPLVQWILCNSHHQCCRVKLEKQFCLFCEAERIVKLMHSKNGNSSFSSSVTAANPNNIARRVKDISTTFKIGRQEDASEFMICLIDKIVDACLRSSQPPERLRPSSGSSYEQLCHSQTIFHDLFGLVLRSRVDCLCCRHTSDTFEVQYTWIIGVRNQTDVRESLKQFVSPERLSGENLYRCIKCKQLVPAVKRYTLHKASKILLINLKRFEFGKNSHKLSHLVRYPEYLDVRPYMSEENSNDQSLNYRLYAVLVHVGASMHSGHYFSYVRSPNNRWYKADDTTMTACDLSQVLSQHGAYILCYIKETPASSTTSTTSTNSNVSPPNTRAATPSKLYYQNGKPANGDQLSISTTNSRPNLFTPRQIPIQNITKPTNGQNGSIKPPVSQLTKPTIVKSLTTESTNGNGILADVKREPLVMRIPNLSSLQQRTITSGMETPVKSSTISTTTLSTTSTIVHRPNSTSNMSSTTKNSNFIVCPATSLSAVRSTSSPLKLIIKASGPSNNALSGLASISSSYNHNDDDDDDNENNGNSSDSPEPILKKARLDETTTSTSSTQSCSPVGRPSVEMNIPVNNGSTTIKNVIPLSTTSNCPPKTSDSNSTNGEQSLISNSSTSRHRKRKKKKSKSHKHHHHRHHRVHHHHHHHHHNNHHRRSRHENSRSRSNSLSASNSRSRSFSKSASPSNISHHSDERNRRHRKTRKHHRHKRSTSTPSSSSFSSSSASPSNREHL